MKKRVCYLLKIGDRINNRKAFIKILVAVTCCILMSIILLSSLMYGVAYNFITKQSVELYAQSFLGLQVKMNDIQTTVNTLAMKLIVDENTSKILLTSDIDTLDPLVKWQGINELEIYKSMYPYIESIYLYNGEADKFVTSERQSAYIDSANFADAGIMDIIKDNKSKSDGFIKRKKYDASKESQHKGATVYTHCLKQFVSDNEVNSAIVINISEEWLQDEMMFYSYMNDTYMATIDEENKIIDSFGNETALKKSTLEQATFEMKQNNEIMIEVKEDGEKYIIFDLGNRISKNRWIAVKQWDSVFGVLTAFKKITMMLIIVVIFVAVIISLLGATSIYKFYWMVENSYNKLLKHRAISINQLKEVFLNEFIEGVKTFSKDEIEEKIEEYKLNIPIGGSFKIVALHIAEYEGLKSAYEEKELYNIKNEVAVMFEQVVQGEFDCSFHIIKENVMVFLLAKKYKREEGEKTLEQLFDCFYQEVKVLLDWNFNMLGTEEVVKIEDVPSLWNEMSKQSKQLFFYSINTYVDYEVIKKEHWKRIDYRCLDDKGIIEALTAGNINEVIKYYKKFTLSLIDCDYMDYINSMNWLSFAIIRIRSKYDSGSKNENKNYANDFMEKLRLCDKVTDVEILFIEIFEEIRILSEQNNVKSSTTSKISEVKKYFEEYYTDPNLTLDSVAKRLSLSSSYLAKLFKKEEEMSASEYINRLRLKHAEQEILNSDRLIKDIAIDCGFSSANYFYTYFKKRLGMTPQVYREKSKLDE